MARLSRTRPAWPRRCTINPALPTCLVSRVYAYATRRHARLRPAKDVLAYLDAQFAEQGYKFPALLRTIALSALFATIAAPAVKPGTVAQLGAGATQGTP